MGVHSHNPNIVFRSLSGTHTILPDHFPRNCVICGVGLDYLGAVFCYGREMTPKELGALRRQETKKTKRTVEDIAADLSDIMKDWGL